jgi:hypothetical protein
MINLIQKWIVWSVDKEQFFTGSPFNYTTSPSLARIYANYSDAIMSSNTLNGEHHPVELRFHLNVDTLKKKLTTDDHTI